MSRSISRQNYYTPRRPIRRVSCLGTLFQAVLMIVITLALILVLLEAGLRLFAPQIVEPLSGLFQPDTETGYRLRPNVSVHYRSSEADVTFNTDDFGMRVAPKLPVSATTQTMLALGDSFTFGMNVQDKQAFPAVLQSQINGTGTPQWKVENGGVFGYGTDNEEAWLREYGWQQNPKVVLIGFYVGNDVKDVMFGITKTVATADGKLIASSASQQGMEREDTDQQSSSTGIKGWLENNSHAYLFLRSLWYNTLGKSTSKPSKLTVFDAASFYQKNVPPKIDAGWQRTFDLLKAMLDDCKNHNALLVLVAIPAREQVYPFDWANVKAQFALDDADFDLTLPQQKLAAFANQQGIPYIDLLPDFKAKNSDNGLYFRIDKHWTVKGQELAATVIDRELGKMGLVK